MDPAKACSARRAAKLYGRAQLKLDASSMLPLPL